MNLTSAARAYARVGVETGVEGADALRLVVMLYDGALAAIHEARGHFARRDVVAKSLAVGRALRIVQEGLVASLERDRGGGIAGQLADLYDYISRRLALANSRNDVALLDECARLLTELRDAWRGLAEGR
jgi:flagellar protein FliS